MASEGEIVADQRREGEARMTTNSPLYTRALAFLSSVELRLLREAQHRNPNPFAAALCPSHEGWLPILDTLVPLRAGLAVVGLQNFNTAPIHPPAEYRGSIITYIQGHPI